MSRKFTWRQQRVYEVYELLLKGLGRHKIITICNEKYGWNAGHRTIDRYIAEAKDIFEEEAKPRRGAEMGRAAARYDTQYFKADSRKDHRGAIMAVDRIVELFGLRHEADDDRDELQRFLDAIEGDA